VALDSIVRNAIKTANKVSKPVQCSVTHRRWISNKDGFGEKNFDTVTRPALVEKNLEKFVKEDGQVTGVQARLTFLTVVEPQGSTGRDEPIDSRDEFVLPDGTTGPIVAMVGGVVDPVTKKGFLLVGMLGKTTLASQ